MTHSTGEICPTSGQYKVVGEKREITMIEGNTFPPNPTGKGRYTLASQTKHKND